MPWVRLDDQFADHPKVVQAGPLAGWLHICALTYCARYLTDGFIPQAIVPRLADFTGIGIVDVNGGHAAFGHDVTVQELVDRLVDVGLWDVVDGGYMIHDYLDYNPSKEEVMAERDIARRRRAMNSNPELRKAVRSRDGDFCRYCGRKVNWQDRKSERGGTYDHVIPIKDGGTDTVDNIVVACRSCSLMKGGRSPEQAGMTLLPPGTGAESVQDQAETHTESRRDQTEIKTESSRDSDNPSPYPSPDPNPTPNPNQPRASAVGRSVTTPGPPGKTDQPNPTGAPGSADAHRNGRHPPPEEAARSFRLLTDPEVGLGEKQARRLADEHAFSWLLRQVFAWRRDLEAGKVSGPGALVSRCDRHFSAGEITERDRASPLYRRHVSEADEAEERRRKYLPDAYADLIEH